MRTNTSMFVFISPTVFEIQRFEKSQITPPTRNFSEIMPRLGFPGKTRFPVKTNISKIFSPKSRRLWHPSPWQTYFKNSFFFKISQKPLDISKSLFIFAQIRADFYGGDIRTKFVSLCSFEWMGYFLHISFEMEIEFKLTERKLT